jgi:hypothetical protein
VEDTADEGVDESLASAADRRVERRSVGCDELLACPLLEDEDPNGNHRPAEVGASEQSATGSEQRLWGIMTD